MTVSVSDYQVGKDGVRCKICNKIVVPPIDLGHIKSNGDKLEALPFGCLIHICKKA